MADVLSRHRLKPESSIKDGFEWQSEVIDKMRQYLTRNKIDHQTAFAKINTSCNGIISQQELINFLIK